ncbi:MAG: septum formation initiator family protein [Bacteroidia bacterium]|nr:septum formation initiator family protein [Bacteroidia bacterium]
MNKFQQYIQRNPVLRFLKNKYILVILIAFFWLAFLDKYSILSQIKMSKTIERLKADKQFYIQGAEDTDYEIEKLTTDPSELEKYAREKYWLKRNNEDLFIIVDE